MKSHRKHKTLTTVVMDIFLISKSKFGRTRKLQILMLSFAFFLVQVSYAQTQIGSDIVGNSVSFNGAGTIVAVGDMTFDSQRGQVKIYENIGGVWTQIGSDLVGEAEQDTFGRSVSLNVAGDIMATGASENSLTYVRVYQNIAGVWTQLGADIDGEAEGDSSGFSVSLNASGDMVAIGAIGNNGNGNLSGHVRVYQNIGGVWTQIGADIDGEAAFDQSGRSVSLNATGDIVAIGATNNGGNGSGSGHVRVYQNIAGVWTQIGADIDGEAAVDQSGRSVSLNATGDIVAIGATNNDGNGFSSGHVRVYQNIAGVWTQIGADIDGEAADDFSGGSVSLNATGDIVAIGAVSNGGNGNLSGHVRVFKNIAGVWTQLGEDIDGEAAGDRYGGSVSLNAEGNLLAAAAASFGIGHAKVFLVKELLNSVPSANDNQVAKDANITLTFSSPTTLSASNTIVTGSQTGTITGTFSNNGTATVTFDPTSDFKPGELITVQITTASGANPYNFSFRVQPASNGITGATPVQKNTISTVSKLIDVASGDLDGDGDIDLIAVSHTTSELIWFQNDGAAQPSFTAQPALYDGADTEELISVVLGDADNDGDLDIFFGAEIADKIFFIKNNGNGTFGAVTEINAGTADGLTTVFLGDLDGDGFIDILASSAADNTLAWYKNNGGTGFGSETIISNSLAGAYSVKVGDMDNDGDLDVIGAAATGDQIVWYPNNGDGTFGSSTVVGASTDGVHSVSVGDLDGDGDLDVTSANLEEDSILWYENTGTGASFTERTVYHDASGTSSDRVINVDIKDLDGDGDLDILWAADVEVGLGGAIGTLGWSRNDGGSPISWTYLPVDATAIRGYSVDAADLTGDGKLEFIGTALGGAGGIGAALSWYKLHLVYAQLQIGGDIVGEAAGDESGRSVSLNATGDIVAIGATRNDGNGESSGHVRVYQNIAGVWTQLGSDIDGEAAGNQSGGSVSLNAAGDIVAIGAALNDGNGNGLGSGHVRIYQNIAGVWTQLGSDIDGEAGRDYSGRSVSLNAAGDIVAIGALGNDGNGNDSGHVRVYQNIAGVWTQIGADIDGEAARNTSGNSVSLNATGDIVAIGANQNSGNGLGSGHVRIYQNIAGVWTQLGSDIDGEAAFDNFGNSVSLNTTGDIVAIGANRNDGNGSDSGHVRVYQNIAGVWTQIGSDIDGEAAGDFSGVSVSLNATGDIVAIGAIGNDGNGNDYGHIRVYQNVAGVWTQIGSDIDGDQAFHQLGFSVSLNAEGSVLAAGALQAFDYRGLTKVFLIKELTNSVPSANSTSAAIDANIVMTFSSPITLSASNTIVTGSQTGVISGTFSNNGTSTITFDPTSDFKPGELITVQITTASGANPYNFSFRIQPSSNPIHPASPVQENIVSTIPGFVDLASGDLDGDGDIDLIAVSYITSDLIWFQNDGATPPSFTAQPALYDGTDILISVTLGDADNDGDLDIFFGGNLSDKIFFIQNTGGGTFGAATEINTGTADGLTSVFLGDLDGDGLIDLVASSQHDSTLAWYKNNGVTGFGSETIISSSLGGAFNVKVGDMDNDGDLDVIGAAASGDQIVWYPNNGDGSFGTSIEIGALADEVRSISVGDLDGDGDLDIASAHLEEDSIFWYENTGSGASFTRRTVYSGAESDGATTVVIKDLDGDGDLDILWGSNKSSGTIAWSRNDGGSPVSWTYIPVDATATQGYSVDAADLNGDGKLEFIGTALGGSGGTGAALSWYKLDVPAFLSVTPSVNSTTATTDANIVMTFSSPITLSSDNTIVTGSQTGKITGTFSNNGTSTITFDPSTDFKPGELITVQITAASGASPYNFSFRVQPTINIITPSTEFTINTANVTTNNNPASVVTGDLDNDGHLDIVAVTGFTNKLLWYKSNGAPIPSYTEQILLQSGSNLDHVILGDADNDGDLDIFFSSRSLGKIFFIENEGGGTFGSATEINPGTSTVASNLFLGDLDGDGLIDLLTATSSNHTLVWYKNEGGHNFGSETIIGSIFIASSIKVGDMDNDGDLDVIGTGASFESEIRWFVNNGNGIFSTSILVVSNGFKNISIGDIDGDNDLDIVSWGNETIKWYENTGNGVDFTEREVVPISNLSQASPLGPVIIDVDGDGDLDIISIDTIGEGGIITWSRNDGGSPISWTRISSGGLIEFGSSITAGDLDNDGKIEIVGASSDARRIIWVNYNINNWTGTTDTDWGIDTNWSLGTVPIATTIAKITSNNNLPVMSTGRSVQELNITAPGGLTIGGSGSLTTSNGTTINHGGSLIVDGTYTGSLTYNLTIPDTNWHLISSPVTGEQYDDAWITTNGIASGSGNNRGIASYTNTTDFNGDWAYFQAGNPAENFNIAKGYSMLRSTSGNYGFIGSLQSSDQNPTITASDIGGANENRWNLIGNPFPSYIDVNAFLTLSANATALTDTHRAIYVWNGTRYTPINNGYIHPGQGFFVNSDVVSTSVALSKNMLSHQTGVNINRNSQNNLARLIVHLSDQDNTDLSTEIQYRESQTKGLDPGFDLGSFTGASSSFSLNTHLVEDSDGTDFTIQSLSDSSDCLDNVVIPLSVKASSGNELTFSITTADFPEDVTVYLEDVAENTFTRLDVSGSDYRVTIDEDISGIGRFYLHTNPGALGTEEATISRIHMYTHQGTLYIQGLPEIAAEIELYDLLGRRAMLHAFRGNGNNQIVLPLDVSKGIYLVRLTTEEGKLSKKIVIK